MAFLIIHSIIELYQLISPLHNKLHIEVDMLLFKINVHNFGDDNPCTYLHPLTLIPQWPSNVSRS